MFEILKYFDISYQNSLKLHKKLFKNSKCQKSIVFISFHKCATGFFSKKVFKELNECRQIDYLQEMYDNNNSYYPLLKNKGYIYGVIRLQNVDHPRYEFVNDLLRQKEFLQLRHIFWIRDPRDILVSMYYSFGLTHGYSNISTVQEYQKNRRKLMSQSLDEYVISEAPNVYKKFSQMSQLVENSNDCILLRYEDMVNNFDGFYKQLNSFVAINDDFYNDFKNETKPREVEDINSHKRSGKVGGFRKVLLPETIVKINKILADPLERFHYD